jgi:hypothetical protein
VTSVASVAEDLARWSERFAGGRIRDVALFRPKLQPGERLAVRVALVGVSEQRAAASMAEWQPRPGSTGPRGRSEGLAYATSERVFVANMGKVSHEWHWGDLFAVRVLPNLDGVSLARTPDPDTVEVIAGERRVTLLPGLNQSARQRALAWIKVEAAFFAWRGELDGWMRSVPERFDRVAR